VDGGKVNQAGPFELLNAWTGWTDESETTWTFWTAETIGTL